MKLSTATLFFFASGISAMPWSFGPSKSNGRKVINVNEDITVQFKISPEITAKSQPVFSQLDVCWLVCWDEEPTCPETWYSNNVGSADSPCWTCCKTPGDL